MQFRILFILLSLAFSGCAETETKGKNDANNVDNANNLNNTNNTNNQVSCEAHETLAGERCVPDRVISVSFHAVTGFPQSFEQVYLCNSVLVDEEVNAEFESSDELLAEVGECQIKRNLRNKNSNGFEIGGNDFGEVSLSGPGVETMLDEEVGEDQSFAGCITTSQELDFEYETSYTIRVAGGADSPPFEFTGQTPARFDNECNSPVPGEDFEVTWTPVGADEVIVDLQNFSTEDPIEIRCKTTDSGRFVVPAEATEFLKADDYFVDIQGINREVQIIDGVEINARAGSSKSCFDL